MAVGIALRGRHRLAGAGHRRRARLPLVLGSALVAIVALPVTLAPLLSLPDPLAQDIAMRLQGPGTDGHVLGTDELGRDLLSRVVYGGRISLLIGFFAALVSGVVGTIAGIAAGYFGGLADSIVSRLVEIQLSLPLLMLLLLVVAIFGPSILVVTILIGLAQWPPVARLARSLTLVEREKPYVDAARAVGAPRRAIMFREILPNITAPILVMVLLMLAQAVLLESTLSYLGLGVSRPHPTWGRVIADGQQYITSAWWLVTVPGLVISLLVLGVNLCGESLRERTQARSA